MSSDSNTAPPPKIPNPWLGLAISAIWPIIQILRWPEMKKDLIWLLVDLMGWMALAYGVFRLVRDAIRESRARTEMKTMETELKAEIRSKESVIQSMVGTTNKAETKARLWGDSVHQHFRLAYMIASCISSLDVGKISKQPFLNKVVFCVDDSEGQRNIKIETLLFLRIIAILAPDCALYRVEEFQRYVIGNDISAKQVIDEMGRIVVRLRDQAAKFITDVDNPTTSRIDQT